jgi:hypothetical protein
MLLSPGLISTLALENVCRGFPEFFLSQAVIVYERTNAPGTTSLE